MTNIDGAVADERFKQQDTLEGSAAEEDDEEVLDCSARLRRRRHTVTPHYSVLSLNRVPAWHAAYAMQQATRAVSEHSVNSEERFLAVWRADRAENLLSALTRAPNADDKWVGSYRAHYPHPNTLDKRVTQQREARRAAALAAYSKLSAEQRELIWLQHSTQCNCIVCDRCWPDYFSLRPFHSAVDDNEMKCESGSQSIDPFPTDGPLQWPWPLERTALSQ